MHKAAKRTLNLSCLLALTPQLLFADFFWDQGFIQGLARPELPGVLGTAIPLTFVSPCLFPTLFCGDGPATG